MALRFASIILILGLFAPFIAGQTATTGSTASITSPSAPDRSAEGVQICYGRGAICDAKRGLYDQCENEQDAHGLDGYWECVCTSGYAAVQEACEDCQMFYGVITTRYTNYTVTCSSKSYTLAPIPSSVLGQQSSHNATRGTGARTSQQPTYVVTVNAMPTVPLPTVATTFALPLATGSASRSLAHSPLPGVLLALGISLGLW
ncbi:hypothetical protein F5144DRAFT_559164 [Chaetomium tenue]|uniref:Uncharacterized protein n=1 Tax=Chaetomium tenue TaxID=1854479 RepID=A0ACB7PTB0_9PEZI|nr:hypothetical protein F5144DRAFT_559164 [Chaetomium globosum]